MADTVKALVLPPEFAASGEAQAIGGLPGRWTPGRGYAPEALGMTLVQVKELVESQNLPLRLVDLDADEVAYSFDREPGTHIPSGLARPEKVRLADAEAAAESDKPIVNDQGVPVMTPSAAPPQTVPEYLKPKLAADTSRSLGEQPEGQPIAYSEMSEVITGGPVSSETPDLALPDEVAAAEEAKAGYTDLLKPQLVELAKERGIDSSGTVDQIRERLVAADVEPSAGPEDLVDHDEDGD